MNSKQFIVADLFYPKGWYTGEVKLWDLPSTSVYIKLEPNFERKLKTTILKVGRTKKYISLFMKIPFDNLRGFFRGQAKSFGFFDKLISFLYIKNNFDFNHSNLSKNIVWIGCRASGKGIINPKIPFNFNNVSGMTLISAILHDGGITRYPTVYPLYRNYEKVLLDTVAKSAEAVVGGVEITTYPSKLNFPKILGLILVKGTGMCAGPKTISNQQIPEFIITSSDELKAAFLRQAFDDDGSIYIRKYDHGGREINIVNTVDVSYLDFNLRKNIKKSNLMRYSSNTIQQTKTILESLGINSKEILFKREYKTRKGEIKHTWKLSITYKKDFKIFREKIGFLILRKQRKLDVACL